MPLLERREHRIGESLRRKRRHDEPPAVNGESGSARAPPAGISWHDTTNGALG